MHVPLYYYYLTKKKNDLIFTCTVLLFCVNFDNLMVFKYKLFSLKIKYIFFFGVNLNFQKTMVRPI